MNYTPDTITLSRDNAYAYCMSVLRVALMVRGKDGQTASLDDVRQLLPVLDSARLAIVLRDIDYYLRDCEWAGSHPDDAAILILRDEIAALPQRDAGEGPFEIEISRKLLQRLVRVGVAYALGRMTYMVSWQAGMAEAHAAAGLLDADTIEQIVAMVDARRDAHDAQPTSPDQLGNGALGMDTDYRRWLRMRDDLARHLPAPAENNA